MAQQNRHAFLLADADLVASVIEFGTTPPVHLPDVLYWLPSAREPRIAHAVLFEAGLVDFKYGGRPVSMLYCCLE